MATMPNLQADFMNRYTSEVPPMPGLMGGLVGESGESGGGGRTGGIGLVQNRSASQWGGLGGRASQYQPNSGTGGGVSAQEINPMSFNSGVGGGVGGGVSGPGATGDLAGDLDAGIPGHHSADEYGGVIGTAHAGLQGAFGALSNLGAFGALSQAASYSQQGPKDKTDIDKPSTMAAMDPMGFGMFGGTPISGILGLAATLADKLGFGENPTGTDLTGLGLADFPGLSIGEGFSGLGAFGGPDALGGFGVSIGEGFSGPGNFGGQDTFGGSIGDTSIGDPGSFGGDQSGDMGDSSSNGSDPGW